MLGRVQCKNLTEPGWNWTVSSWVFFFKAKSRSCGHQITFLVNPTFSKLLHITPPSSPTIIASCERCLCFASHLGHQKDIAFVPKLHEFKLSSWVSRVNEWCWKTQPFPPSFLCMVMDSDVGQVASAGNIQIEKYVIACMTWDEVFYNACPLYSCSMQADICVRSPCMNGATCIKQSDYRRQCVCADVFTGDNCATNISMYNCLIYSVKLKL